MTLPGEHLQCICTALGAAYGRDWQEASGKTPLREGGLPGSVSKLFA